MMAGSSTVAICRSWSKGCASSPCSRSQVGVASGVALGEVGDAPAEQHGGGQVDGGDAEAVGRALNERVGDQQIAVVAADDRRSRGMARASASRRAWR